MENIDTGGFLAAAGGSFEKRMSFVSPGGKRRASARKASLARAGKQGGLLTPSAEKHPNVQRSSKKKEKKKERRFGTKKRLSYAAKARRKSLRQSRGRKGRTSDYGGALKPSTVGANVRVLWMDEELERMHFAAIHVPWSFVGTLRDGAERAGSDQMTGMMEVDIADLQRGGKPLFEEDFNEVFRDIFVNRFVPCVHEKFNMKGEKPQALLPEDIGQAFKMLVLCERLKAALRDDVYGHIKETLEMDKPPPQAGDAAIPFSFAMETAAFALVQTSLSFADRAPQGSLQETVIEQAVTILVDLLPHSLPALQNLVSEASEHGRPDMAVQLFKDTTERTLSIGNMHFQDERERAENFVNEIKARYDARRDANHLDVFARHLVSATSRCKEAYDSWSAQRERSSAGVALKQGVLLEKACSPGGDRIVRVFGNRFEWRKLAKKNWESTPAKAEKYLIRKEEITMIGMKNTDRSGRTFEIVGRGSVRSVSFRASDPQSCRHIVETLKMWWTGAGPFQTGGASETILPTAFQSVSVDPSLHDYSSPAKAMGYTPSANRNMQFNSSPIDVSARKQFESISM